MAASVPIVPRPAPIAIPPHMVMAIARYLAKKAIKQCFRDQGRNPVHIAPKVIAVATWAYLDDHRAELLEEAEEFITSAPGLRKLAEQEAKRRRKLYQITPPRSARPTSTIPTAWRQAQPVSNKG